MNSVYETKQEKHLGVNKKIFKEDGVAIFIALFMLLIMSILAITVAFNANIDFQTMANYKRGQQSFLAAERCVAEARRRFETEGIEFLFFQLQNNTLKGIEEKWGRLDPETNLPVVCADEETGINTNEFSTQCMVCRTGPRDFHRSDPTADPVPFINILPPTKTSGRPIKNTSMPSGGAGGAALVPVTFIVTGKDEQDKDKTDTNREINTGTEIAVGFETFVPGGATNVY